LEPELGLVVVGDRPQVLASRLIQRLHGLKNFKRQTLRVANTLQVLLIGTERRSHALFGDRDLRSPRQRLGMRLGHLAGHLIEDLDLLKTRLIDPGSRDTSSGCFAMP
jgi:hypothetical protein